MASFTINLHEDQRFSCHACGKCCTDKWHVKIAPEKFAGIETTQAYRNQIRQGYTPIELVDGQHRVTRKENGDCRFLNQKRCEIHAEVGAARKPAVCQLFPFTLVNTPDGHFVSMSYACPSVLANKGQPAPEHLNDLTNLVRESSYFEIKGNPSEVEVKISEQLTVSWSEYLVLEQELLSGIGGEDPVGYLLQAALSLVAGSPVPVLLQEAYSLLCLFAVNSISVLEREHQQEQRGAFSEELQDGGAYSTLLSTNLPPFQVTQPVGKRTKDTLARYLNSVIWGKRLVSGSTVVTRMLLLATTISILLYYLRVRGNSDDPESLEWGFDLIETNLFTHSEDLEPMFLEFERVLYAISG